MKETFDIESKTEKRESTSSRAYRDKGSKFNCLIAVSLILFIGFFILILLNFRIGRQEVIVEIQSLQASVKDSLADGAENETCEEEDLCLTKECVLASARMLSFMDETKKPCEDFYEFACANYPRIKAVRYGEDVYDPRAEAIDNIDIYIKRFMDEPEPYSKNASFNAMKILYDSCMNSAERDTNSSDPLIHFFEVHGLSWPILNDETEQEISWTHFVTAMEKHGILTIFQPFIFPLDHDLTSVVLRCSMPMLPPRIYLNPNDEAFSGKIYFYKNVILLFLDQMGIRRTEGKKVFDDIMKLETELAATFTDDNTIDDDCNQPCSKSWCPPCKTKSSEELYPLSSEHVHQLTEIYAGVLNVPAEAINLTTDCSGNFEEMLRILNAANKKTLMNYLGWRAVAHLMQFMGSKYQQLYNHYAGRIMIADTIPATRWRECAQFLSHNMGVIIAKALVDENYIKHEQFLEIKERFSEVKNSFVHLLHTVPWLDNQTMPLFVDKLNKATLEIGYPDKINEFGVLDDVYADLHIDANHTYFSNVLKLKAFLTNKAYSARGHNSRIPGLRPLEPSAAYDYNKNLVEIGLGNLMSPLLKYGPGMQKYLQYGQEVILAHQISHAFDTKGITYDGSGTEINAEHLPEIVRRKFHEFVICLSQQYSTSAAAHDNSAASIIDRDIADLGSFFITAAGLERSIESDHGDDIGRLPGLPYTKRQIYFLQASQMFCEIQEKYSMRKHPPSIRTQKQRVNGAISNMLTFGDAFSCSAGTKMNPSNKCNLLV